MSALVIDHALYKAGIGAPVCLTTQTGLDGLGR